MIVKIDDAPGVGGGAAVQVFNDDGTPIWGQVNLVLENSVNEIPRVTVTFIIDGEKNRLVK